jgi:hypothetical protein
VYEKEFVTAVPYVYAVIFLGTTQVDVGAGHEVSYGQLYAEVLQISN